MMKRLIALLGVLIVAVTVFAACGGAGNQETGTVYRLYFANAEKNKLVSEDRTLQVIDQEDAPRLVMEQLLEGPTSNGAVAAIPAGTTLISLEVADRVASVNLSKEYYQNEDAAELLARYSIVNTLCDIEGIDKVKLFVDGIELMNANNNPVGALGKDDIVINPQQNNATEKSKTVRLYFSDAQAEKLVPEDRRVTVVENNLEKTVVLELIKGPEDSENLRTVPAETKVLSVETQEGICFVNLSSDFVTKHSGGSAAEQMTVFSIVNSLTELPTVQQVQFLVDGKKLDVYKHMEFSQPFVRNQSLL